MGGGGGGGGGWGGGGGVGGGVHGGPLWPTAYNTSIIKLESDAYNAIFIFRYNLRKQII